MDRLIDADYDQVKRKSRTGSEKEVAPDLSAKSTQELVGDIFSIINNHIGERGSISNAPALDESLYQKIKPYLIEIVKRAKAKALDARAYLFGAVDSMPEGKAKQIYEEAARRYADEQDVEHYERLSNKVPAWVQPNTYFNLTSGLSAHIEEVNGDQITWRSGTNIKTDPIEKFLQFAVEPESQKTKTESAPEAESAYGKVADKIFHKLIAKEKFTRNELFEMAAEAFGGTLAEGKFSAKDAYDAMEMGINKYLEDQLVFNPNIRQLSDIKTVLFLKDLFDLIPTQTTRTEEMDEFQQFSTPPALAFVANWVANLKENDVYLEPSAGTGNIAIFGKIENVKETIVNELAPRRAAILKELGFDQVFTENAEQIHNILPKEIKPTVVVMNPPFSSTAGRIGRRKTSNTTVHIEQALKRLQPGGRHWPLWGRNGSRPPDLQAWFNKLANDYILGQTSALSRTGIREIPRLLAIKLLLSTSP